MSKLKETVERLLADYHDDHNWAQWAAQELQKALHEDETKRPNPVLAHSNENWLLVERYVNTFNPPDFRLVFKREQTVLEIPVPEEAWRAFDGLKVGE
jgi:esterase/lipase superfamily enzyme